VVSSVLIITATTIVRRVREGTWQGHVAEIIVFGFLLLIALLILAIALPSVAKVFALLGLVGAFVVNGPAVFGLLGDFGRGKGNL
jgi:hypothetical protein